MKEKIKCLINEREFQVAIIVGIIAFILNRVYPSINIWRLTPTTYLRQFWLSLEPAAVVGVISSCIVGPWASIIIAVFSANPLYIFEVDLIVKAAQFMAIGYAHRKIRAPWNIIAIPLGVAMTLIVHPTLVQYILARQVIIHLYWGQNLVFQVAVIFILYLIVRLTVPQIFEWTDPINNYKLNLDFIRRRARKTRNISAYNQQTHTQEEP